MDGSDMIAIAAGTTSVFLKPGYKASRQNQFLKGRPILSYPIPDYTKVKPKTNTYKSQKSGSQNIQVSGVVTYKYSMVHM
jgi:hypothetical protein